MLTYAVLFLLAGIVILVVEFFVPSHGMLGIISTLSILGSIAAAFNHSTTAGLAFLVTSLIVVPALIMVAIQYWPDTPLGKRMLIPRPEHQDEMLPETDAYRRIPELIGRRGKARTVMLPGGTVEVEGRKYDAVTEGMAIEEGQPIVVIRVETQRLVVRPDDRIPQAELVSPIAPARPMSDSDRSRQSEKIADPFEEPLI